jgi:hypothetical protein
VQIWVRLAFSGFRGLFRQGEIITNPDKPRLEMGGTESPLPHILSRGRRDFLLRPSCKKTVAIRLQCDDEKTRLDKAYYGPCIPVTYVSTLVVTVRSSYFIISCCWTHGEWGLLCDIRILCLQKSIFLRRSRKVECLFSLVKSDGWNRVDSFHPSTRFIIFIWDFVFVGEWSSRYLAGTVESAIVFGVSDELNLSPAATHIILTREN